MRKPAYCYEGCNWYPNCPYVEQNYETCPGAAADQDDPEEGENDY